MPRSSTPNWGATAHYELGLDSTSGVPSEIKQAVTDAMSGTGILKIEDVAQVYFDAITIAGWASQEIPERRRSRQTLTEIAAQLDALIVAIDQVPPTSRGDIGPLQPSHLAESELSPEVTLLLEYPKQLIALDRRLRRAQSEDLQRLRHQAQATAWALEHADDFSQSHLVDAMLEAPWSRSNLHPTDHEPDAWLQATAQCLADRAREKARALSRKGRDDHPWLHGAVEILAKHYERLSKHPVTYYLDFYENPVRTKGATFILNVLRGCGAEASETAVMNAIRRHLRAGRRRSADSDEPPTQ